MKRFTLILSLLVAMVTTAMAGNLVGSTTDNPVYFKLKNANGNYIKANAVDGDETTAGKFAFYAVDGVDNAYYIYSVDEAKWFNYTLASSYSNMKGFISLSEEKGNYFNFTECSIDGKNGYQIAPYNTTGVAAKYLNYFQGADGNSTIGLWQGDGNGDAGSCWLLEEYADVTYVLNPADITSTALYTIVPKASNRGVIFANSESTHLTTTSLANEDIQDANQQFMFITKDDKTYLYSVGANKFVNDEGKYLNLTAAPKDYVVVEQADVEGYMLIKMNAVDLINVSTGWTHGALADYNTVDDGNRLRIRYVKEASEELLAAIDEIFSSEAEVTYNFVYYGVTLATQTEKVLKGAAYPAIKVQAPYGVTPVAADLAFMSGTVTGDVTKEIRLEVTKELPFETAASANAITTWYLVRMHTNQPGYIGDIAEDNTVNVAPGKSSDVANENYIWGFVGDVFSGITVVNKGTGKKLTSTGSGNVTLTDEGTPFFVAETSETSENATNGFCLRRSDSNQYLNAYYGSVGKLNHWGSTDAGSTFFLSEYEEDVVTVSEAGWATMYLGYQAYIPEGVNVYAVTGVENGWVTKSQLEGVIPANTGVLLENAGEFTFKRAAKDVNALEGNLMNGSVEDTYVEGTAYVLAKHAETGVGMYKAELNKDAEGNEGTTHFLNNAGKAYMVLPAASETVAFYGLDWDGTTGISEVKGENGNVKAIYDLTGRKVETISAPGIYIVGGKKVLVR